MATEAQELNEIEASLRESAKEIDQDSSEFVFHDELAPPAKRSPEAPAVEPEPKAEEPEVPPTKPEPKSAEAEAEAANAEADNETPYQKAVREKRDREAKAWQKIEEEKQTLARERAELEQLRRNPPAPPAKPKPFIPDGERYSAADFADAAKGFADDYRKAKEVDFDDAAANRAASLHNQALAEMRRVQQAEQHYRQTAFQQKWQESVDRCMKEEPDLALDPATKQPMRPLGQRVIQIIRDNPELAQTADGFAKAVRFAKAETGSESASALKAQNEKLQKEIDRLSRLTNISPTPPARRTSGSTKSREPSERELREQVMAHDSGDSF